MCKIVSPKSTEFQKRPCEVKFQTVAFYLTNKHDNSTLS